MISFILGILKRSLLSLQKVELKQISNRNYRSAVVYKHYIFFFKSEEQSEDCIVFDTQEETAINTATGLHLGARSGYSIYHWKDNIFVLFGSTTSPPQKTKVFGVQLLEVNEEECKDIFLLNFEISFSENFFQGSRLWNFWWREMVGDKSYGADIQW